MLRANQLWAPQTDNDPDGARAAMERFYTLLKRQHDSTRARASTSAIAQSSTTSRR